MLEIPGRRYMSMQTSLSGIQELNKKLSPKTKGTLMILNDFAMQKFGLQNADFVSFNRVPW